ncbi:MAG: peptide chain release factor-like protein [Candidatus Peregrinibacteria bacterium]|nr:peptide chain release factor-like protein [Candidatus Peregrinibacteria bacterium]MDZ4245261.1 peptide chain release factor-like protein [Candidatus Gracilibacteria bacterium]
MKFPVELTEKHLEKAKQLNIKPEDIEESFVLGSGAGGQKINKTASCVLLRHRPTGTEVRCHLHREQSKNRISAYKLLIDKIEFQIKGEQSEKAKKIHKLKKQKQRRSKKAKEKILEAKHHRAELKETRKSVK